MTYLRPHNQDRNKARRTWVGFVVAVVVVVALVQLFVPHFFPAIFSAVARPFWRVEFAVDNDGFMSRDFLLRENESLKVRLADLTMRMSSSTLELLESQNQELLAFMGRASTTPTKMKVAAVLAHPSFLPYDELLIDLGTSDDISTSTLVYAPGRVLLGRVADILGNVSKVILFSSPKQTFGVEIGQENIPATATGRGGGQYEADVPHGSVIAVGDIVGDANIHDRAFGIVVKIISDPSNPFDKILFAPPINIYELHFVQVEAKKP